MTDNTTEKAPKKTSSDELKLKDLRNDRMGLDSIMDDMIGLNIRGLKSLLAVCFRPAPYFQAAKIVDWGGKYRASFRLLFAILALTAATRFIWASDTSPMLVDLATMFDQMIAEEVRGAKAHGQTLDISSFNSINTSSLIMKKTMLVLPFATTIGFAFLAWVYRAWGERLSYVVRLRYTYGVLIPSMTLGLLFSLLTIFVPQGAYEIVTAISMILPLIAIALTAYFGPLASQETGARAGRSICAAIVMMGFYFLIIAIIVIPFVLPVFESIPQHDHSLPLIEETN